MSDFFESEAEVSDEEDGVKQSSDEEDEEEGDNENLEDLINDEEEEEPDKSDDSDDEVRGSKKRSYDEADDRLEDDDYDLIEENLGVRVDRKKFRRLRRIEDDESDDEDDAGPSAEVEDDRDAIALDLFKPGDDEEEETVDEDEGDYRRHRGDHQEDSQPLEDQFAEIDSGDEESDPDDFIVDDSGQPIARKKKKGHKARYTDSALQEAQDIFGVDFDFEEFDQYDDQYEDEDTMEDEYDEYEDDEAVVEGQERRKGKRPSRKHKSKTSIYEVFEPSELERGHFTDRDNEIRTADVPERFMLRRVPVTEADNLELEEEADWIYHQAFLTPTISNQEFSDQGEGGYNAALYERKPPRTKNKIREALHFMRNQHFEVPFIAFYRKEYVEPELNFNDLYKVYHWDEKWCQLKNRKENLKKLFEKMQAYQFDQISIDSDELLPDSLRTLTETDLERLNEVDTMEKLKDVYLHFLLYYGRDIPKMHNAAKQKPKKIKIVISKKKVMKTIKKTILVKRRKKKKEDEKKDEGNKEESEGEDKKGEEEDDKSEEKKAEEDEDEKKAEEDEKMAEGEEDKKMAEGDEKKVEGEEGDEKKVEGEEGDKKKDTEKKDEEESKMEERGTENGEKEDTENKDGKEDVEKEDVENEDGVEADSEKEDVEKEDVVEADSEKEDSNKEGKEEEDEEKMDDEEEKKDEGKNEKMEEGEVEDEKEKNDKEEKEKDDKEEKDKEEGEIMDDDNKDKEGEDEEIKEKDEDEKEEGEMEDSEEEVEEEIEEEVETEEEEELEITDDEDEGGTSHEIKQATRKSLYAICQEAGLDGFAKKFGLTPEQFAENLRDNYGRYDPEQYPDDPLDAAKEYMSRKFNTPEAVLKATCYMVALQLAHEPLVRQCVRQTFYERAKICVTPTKKGIKEIDEAHSCFGSKYLKNKQVKDLLGDQFLRLLHAESDRLITMTISIDMEKGDTSSFSCTSYFEEIKQLYYRDEFSSVVQAWNKERSAAIEIALNKVLYKEFIKEIRAKLELETKEGIIKLCCRKLFEWLKVMPYQADQQMDDEDDDEYLEGGGHVGLRVMGIATPSESDTSSFCALLDGDGEVSDFLRLPHFLRKKNAYWQRDRELKQADIDALKNFIANKKPHVIAVSSETRLTLKVIEDIKQCIQELESEQQMTPINVQLMDSNCAYIYMNSKQAEAEFREYPILLRQAISVARRLQDPLVELARMCNPDEDIMCVQFHPMQEVVNKDDLREGLYQEFIYRVNEVGVDLNRAISHHHTQSLVQFVCGLGPRKGNAMIRTLKQQNQHLENRNHLVTVCELGPKVFINCAGFVKIDTTSVIETTDAYIEVLDSTRIHPETYEWARKMAVDALEYDESAEDANPAEALEEILENPDKLKDLDLDAFAEELERQGYGNKSITLYDIRAELNSRYKDLRTPYHPPAAEEVFSMLTKETPETFYKGKMCLCKVSGIARRRPPKDELDNANPVRNDTTGLWQCPFCQQDDFPELSEVWSHFDAGSCPGQAIGVHVQLDNGIQGFIHTRFISDKKVVNPEDRVKMGMTLHCRIMKIDIERFRVDLTCKSSDLQDKNGEWAPSKDTYYDHDTAEKDQKKDEAEKKSTQSTYVKRVIVHPAFHNVTFKQSEKMIAEMEQGEVIIRPSSKGTDHLTVTWKVDEGIFSHIDVREEGKENVFSLGKSLVIGNEEFEDLDEIVARHVQPMAAYVRDVMTHKYYRNTESGKREIMDKHLAGEKKKAPARIPYFMSFSKDFPGRFLLSYQPRSKPRHEYVTVTPDGYRYRQQIYSSINSLLRWFKEHFRDPIPGHTPTVTSHHRTPMGAAPEGTPAPYYAGTPMMHKSGAGLQIFTPSIIATPRQTPNATPQMGARYGNLVSATYTGMQPYSTPQTNPMATPLAHGTPQYHPGMTPSQNPMRTPQYQPTPRASWGGTTPQTQVVRAIQRQVQGQPQMPQQQTAARAAVDWAQQAAQWAKQRQQTNPGRSPATQGGMTPRQGGMTPRQGGMTPRQGGMTPRQGGMTPRQGGITPQQGSMTPRQGGMTPRQGGMTPRQGSMTPRQGGMTPRQGGMTPQHGGMTPQHGSLTPRSSGSMHTPNSMHTSHSGIHDPSPMSISTPAHSQQGDETPLFDET